jgi:hypothetical protein
MSVSLPSLPWRRLSPSLPVSTLAPAVPKAMRSAVPVNLTFSIPTMKPGSVRSICVISTEPAVWTVSPVSLPVSTTLSLKESMT